MNDFDSIIKRITVTHIAPGDYTGEDGLLYCGKCRTPKQFRMNVPPLEGRLLPHPCRCEQERLDREVAEQEARRHRQAVADLKRRGFTDPAMKDWTFANDNGKCPQMKHAHGKIMNDGDRTIVAGLAFPGLQESLGLDRNALDLPDYVEITANAEGFALETTVTLAVNELFNDAASTMEDNDNLDDLSELDDKLDELTDAMDQLIGGSFRLYDGLCALLDSSQELVSGIDQLAAGATQLKQGAEDLSVGAAQLQTGSAALNRGLDQLAGQNDELNGGAAQVFQSLLASANSQLAAAGVQAPELTVENYSQVLDGVIAAAGESPAAQQVAALKASLDNYNGFYQGLQNYTAGVAQAKDGAGELNVGVDALKNGTDSLTAGAGQLPH